MGHRAGHLSSVARNPGHITIHSPFCAFTVKMETLSSQSWQIHGEINGNACRGRACGERERQPPSLLCGTPLGIHDGTCNLFYPQPQCLKRNQPHKALACWKAVSMERLTGAFQTPASRAAARALALALSRSTGECLTSTFHLVLVSQAWQSQADSGHRDC